ncbi:MAG: serine hydrolase domain-containing protein [Cyanobacteria bacterium J06634_5]
MHNTYVKNLQDQLNASFLFTPFLGVNVTIHDSTLGIWHAACGYSEPTAKTAIAPNATFYTYSITKTFVAVIILKLVEAGKLSLTDRLHHLLPALKIEKAITLRQVLNHTSGLPSYTALADYSPSVSASPGKPWPESRILQLLQTDTLDFEPGNGWRYSNTGYFALKKVIEKFSERSFPEALKHYITKPLGLKNTLAMESVPKEHTPLNANLSITPGYSRELHAKNRMEDIVDKYHPGWCYTGLIASTTQETARFYHALFCEELLSQAMLNHLRKPVSIGFKDPHFGNPCYGLGVMIDTQSKYGLMYSHGGQGPGFRPWVVHLPSFEGRALTLAIFANTSSSAIPLSLAGDLLSQLSLPS